MGTRVDLMPLKPYPTSHTQSSSPLKMEEVLVSLLSLLLMGSSALLHFSQSPVPGPSPQQLPPPGNLPQRRY